MRCAIGVLIVVTCCLSAKLPLNFKRCNKNQSDFQQCLIQSAQKVVSLLDTDIDAVGLKSFEPFEAGSHTLPKGSKHVNYEQKFNSLKFFGFKNVQISRFDVDLTERVIYLEFVVPELKWDFDIEFSGTLFTEPVEAKTLGVAIMKNVKYVAQLLLCESEELDGKHLVVVATSLEMDPATLYCKLDKVTKGGMNDVTEWFNKKIVDNFPSVWADVKSNYNKFFGELVASNFNRLFEKVPFSELF